MFRFPAFPGSPVPRFPGSLEFSIEDALVANVSREH